MENAIINCPVKYANCNLCSANAAVTLSNATFYLGLVNTKFKIVKCNGCGFMYLNPMPKQTKDIQKLYGEKYYQFNEMVENDTIRSKYYHRDLRDIEKITAEKGKILDIGCAFGHFLRLAKNRGWQPYGLDISRVSIEYAASFFKKKALFLGDIHSAGYDNDSFDVVYSRHTLEHTLNPLALLKEIYRILKPGGILLLEVPYEFYNCYTIAKIIEFRLQWYLSKVNPIFKAEHLYFFTIQTIKQMLKKTAFSIIRVSQKGVHIKEFENKSLVKRVSLWVLLRGFSISVMARK